MNGREIRPATELIMKFAIGSASLSAFPLSLDVLPLANISLNSNIDFKIFKQDRDRLWEKVWDNKTFN